MAHSRGCRVTNFHWGWEEPEDIDAGVQATPTAGPKSTTNTAAATRKKKTRSPSTSIYTNYSTPQLDHTPAPVLPKERGDAIRSAKPYLATPGATVRGLYGETFYEGDTLVTFHYEKSRSGDITQGLPKVEQVLEVRSVDPISLNLERRVEGWNKCLTRILGIPWGFLIGAELTIAQSRISLVNKIQKVYRSQGVQIHNRHIEIIVRQITSNVLVSEDGMSNVFSPGELIRLLRAKRMGRALEEAICYRALLLGITKASLNTQSFISEASFQETARVLFYPAF
ncbi:uncharacterized protein LOC116027628 [Ipomoea triloba]|uniref:uncharacterized protein LOC116027628 n=1 Tax=Ipomoea triloba TaxID=35885 RepID=UPI00125D9AA0|nr:uncharacterized protein LOC116027628 [Ipomoea triloba]